MMIKVKRMNGIGNRFAIIDARTTPMDTPAMAGLAHRIGGCDQALFLLPPRNRASGSRLFMEIINADGSLAEACGNGVRCVAASEMTDLACKEIIIETRSGEVSCRMQDGMISADMGKPRFDWAEIPLAEPMPAEGILMSEAPAGIGAGIAVNMGNPHIVFFPQDMEALDIQDIGLALEHHQLFPQGINITLAEQKARDHLKIKVWERGAGATRACGTAACASLVAAHRRNMGISRAAKIELPGGCLDIFWRENDSHVLMTGPIEFDGEEMIDEAR